MDPDDLAPTRASDPLAALCVQDLDPLSRTEIAQRIAALEREIVRCRARLEVAADQRASAESLFRR